MIFCERGLECEAKPECRDASRFYLNYYKKPYPLVHIFRIPIHALLSFRLALVHRSPPALF